MTRNEAVKIILEETPTDYFGEVFETPDFFEFHVICGGDSCTYRVYKEDGRLCQK